MLPVSAPLLSDDELVELAEAVEASGRQLDALRLAVAREFDNRSDASLGEDSLARRLGQKTAAGAVELITRSSAEDARRRVIESRNLAKLPVIAGAVERGVLGRAQAAEVIAPLLPALRVADPESVRAACAQLVELAVAMPATAVVEAAVAWAAVLDPDGVEPEEKSALEKRFVTLGKATGGLVKLIGLLPVEQAAAIRAVIDAHVSPRSGESVSFALADVDESAGPKPPADLRTAGQKRADVVHAVFAAAARAADVPTMGGAHPTILVTVTREDVEAGTGAAWIDGEAEPVPARTAARIACSGGRQEVELGARGEILELGRALRVFTPTQRRALAARDKGCVVPGCTIPARWCEIHHVIPWRRGGPTDVGNGVLLCWFHHTIIDDGPWRLRMSEGVPEVSWVFGSHASPWVRAIRAQPAHARASMPRRPEASASRSADGIAPGRESEEAGPDGRGGRAGVSGDQEPISW